MQYLEYINLQDNMSIETRLKNGNALLDQLSIELDHYQSKIDFNFSNNYDDFVLVQINNVINVLNEQIQHIHNIIY